MQRSETIGKLAEALAKAQGKIKGALKDSENPYFKSRYADLAAVWDACREPLSENGLSVIQTTYVVVQRDEAEPHNALSPVVHLETTLCHSTGEWVSGDLPIKPVKDDPQGMGSALTYARRYGLSAIVGIAPEDDDGNVASGKPAINTKEAQKVIADAKIAELKAKIEPPGKSAADLPVKSPVTEPTAIPGGYITEPQRKRFWALCKESGWQENEIRDYLLKEHNITSTHEIPKSKYDLICTDIEAGGSH
jgi:hypothetical protein